MNIYQVTWDFPPKIIGGVGIYCGEIGKQLTGLGHHVTVVTRGASNSGYWDNGCQVIRLGNIAATKIISESELQLFMERAKEAIRRDGQQIDILHLQDCHLVPLAKEFPERAFRTVATIHSLGKNGYTDIPDEVVMSNLISSSPYIDAFTAVSDDVKQNLMQLGIEKSKITTIYNGVDIKKFKPRRQDGDVKSILFLGRLDRDKGILELIEAMRIIVARDQTISLIIAGRGTLETDIIGLINQYHLQQNVFLKGFVGEAQKVELINSSSLVVVPSLYEPFGLVVLEAMACEKPVVVTPYGGAKEIVGEFGAVLASVAPHEIANTVISVLSNGTKYHSAKRVREYVRNNFSWGKSSRRLAAVFEKVLEPVFAELLSDLVEIPFQPPRINQATAPTN